MFSGIECRTLNASYHQADGGEQFVLKDIDARFPAGRMALITGATGAGKSTLLHILAGLQKPASGQVIVNNQAVSRWIGKHRDRWRKNVGIVFQLHHLMNDLTVFENVILPLVPNHISMDECRRQVLETLSLLKLDHLGQSPISLLSGGERQRVAVARAMVNRPRFIFADEPTAHQDTDNTKLVLQVLGTALEWDAVVVMASHDSRTRQTGPSKDCYRLENGTLSPF